MIFKAQNAGFLFNSRNKFAGRVNNLSINICADSAVIYRKGFYCDKIGPGRARKKLELCFRKNPEGIILFFVSYTVAVKASKTFCYIILNKHSSLRSSQSYRRINERRRNLFFIFVH